MHIVRGTKFLERGTGYVDLATSCETGGHVRRGLDLLCFGSG